MIAHEIVGISCDVFYGHRFDGTWAAKLCENGSESTPTQFDHYQRWRDPCGGVVSAGQI